MPLVAARGLILLLLLFKLFKHRLLLVGINTHYPLRDPPPWGAAEIEKSARFTD